MTVPNKKVLVVGISGATCSGKSTVAKELAKVLTNSKIFCQDDYYFPVDDQRHIWISELNHINWDIVSSLDMERMMKDIEEHIAGESSKIPTKSLQNNTDTNCFSKERNGILLKINQSPCHIVIVEGFCIFNHNPVAKLCDLKYYFTLDYDECLRRRVKRVYDPPDCPGYFEKCVWPEHLKQLAEIQRDFKNMVYFDGNSSNQTEDILRDVVKLIYT